MKKTINGPGIITGNPEGYDFARFECGEFNPNIDVLEIVINDNVEDIAISFVEGFANFFIEKFSRESLFEKVVIKSKDKDILIKFSKYTQIEELNA